MAMPRTVTTPVVTFSDVKIQIWRIGWRLWMWGCDYTRTWPEHEQLTGHLTTLAHEWGGLARSERQAMKRVGMLLSGRIPPRAYRLNESKEARDEPQD